MFETKNVMTAQKEISIFRTSIGNREDIQAVKSMLDMVVGQNEWNFDLEDADNILRIHANVLVNAFLTQELQKLGFECEELF